MINDLPPQQIERLSGEFASAMRAAEEIFGKHAFRKRFHGQEYRAPVNKALFESISVSLAVLGADGLGALIKQRDVVVEEFLDLMKWDEFMRAISGGTGDVRKVRLRFNATNTLFREVAEPA